MFCIKRGEFGKSTWSLLLSFARSLGGNGCSNVSYKESLTWLMNPLLLNLSWIEHHWRGPDHGNSDLRHWQAGTSPNDRLAALMTDGEKNDLGHSLKSLTSKVFSSAWWVFLSIYIQDASLTRVSDNSIYLSLFCTETNSVAVLNVIINIF